MNLDDILVILLAGGAGERLAPLTKDRAKPAVYFGGPYRIVDFTLSNCINSGLRRIFIATQYKSLSLNRHIRMGWSVVSEELGEFIEILAPQKRLADLQVPEPQRREAWYLGTADAVYQNLYSITRENPSHVIVLSGDHVYKMDYAKMLRYHIEKNADATIATIEVPVSDGQRFGIVSVDASERVIEFLEKPARPVSVPGTSDMALASMGIYIFKADVLIRALEEDASRPNSQHDFGRNIIPSLIRSAPVYSYRFYDENKKAAKYWRDIGTLDAYFEASMDLCQVNPEFNLYDPEWPLRVSATGAAGQVRIRRGRPALRAGARFDHLEWMHHLGQPCHGQHPLSERTRAQFLRHRTGDSDAWRARRPSRAAAARDRRP
jgi:glucose-1-phosphate adenylyltransferase